MLKRMLLFDERPNELTAFGYSGNVIKTKRIISELHIN